VVDAQDKRKQEGRKQVRATGELLRPATDRCEALVGPADLCKKSLQSARVVARLDSALDPRTPSPRRGSIMVPRIEGSEHTNIDMASTWHRHGGSRGEG
jgi:hypothetical protein